MDVTVGSHHACAIARTGAVTCWGDSSNGKTSPLSGYYTVIRAGANHTCGLADNGTVKCWGLNTSGQTGGVAGTQWMDIASGTNGSCALDIHGAATCWGDNSDGQNSPTAGVWGRIALGTGHGCVYGASGISCWGLNADGQASPPFPGAPTGTTGIGTDSQVVVSWTAPAANGSSIINYTVTASPGPGTCSTNGATTCTVTGLTNHQPYQFTVVATNGAGPGPASSASSPVTPLFGSTYFPVVPNRLVDSRAGSTRTGLAASLTSGTPAMFQVTGRVPSDPSRNVPSTATAVTGNLTVVGQTSLGYVSLTPARPAGIPGTSTLNVPLGDVRANGVTVQLGAGGVLWVTFRGDVGSTTDVIFDVTGYFVPNSTGSTYFPVTPNRLADSRAGSTRTGLSATLSMGAPAVFQVTGRVPSDPTQNVPDAATAITGNLTVVGQTSAGYVSLTPARPAGLPGTSTLNVPLGDIRANGVTVQLGTDGTHGVLWVTFRGDVGSTADVIFDVTGYFVPNATGATYVPLAPNRLVDSRAGSSRTGLASSLTASAPASFQVTGRIPSDPTQNVPAGATAVTGNLTVVGQTSLGYMSLAPARPAGIPATSTLNFPLGDIRANGAAVPLGTGGVLWVTFRGDVGSTTDVVFDVTGYFTM
jgi:hypothetical protein